MTAAPSPPSSPLDVLRRFARPRQPAEQCELCGSPLDRVLNRRRGDSGGFVNDLDFNQHLRQRLHRRRQAPQRRAGLHHA